MSCVLYCLGWGLPDTRVGNIASLFAGNVYLIFFSTTLLANPQCLNMVVHPNRYRAAYSLCHNYCFTGGTHFLVASHCWVALPSTAQILLRKLLLKTIELLLKLTIFSCEFFIVSAISTLLVVRVMRLVINYSNATFLFVASAARLSKYPSRNVSTTGCMLLLGDP